MTDVTTAAQFVTDLVASGQLTSTTQLQGAADNQTNSATSGTSETPTNQAWGSAIPQLMGLTLTAGLPMWVGNFQQNTDSNGNKVTQVDMAVLFGRGAPSYNKATVLQIYLDDAQVWGIANPSLTQPNGAQLDFTFYDGIANVVDPTISTAEGADLTPAFTGMMYLVLRSIVVSAVNTDNVTSVPQVTLPQVRAEIVQQYVEHDSAVTIYGFASAPEDNPAVAACLYDPIGHRMLHLLDDLGAVDIYGLDTATYIGRTNLQNYTQHNLIVGAQYLWQDNILLVTGRHPTPDSGAATGFWDIDVGTLLNPNNNPVTGIVTQISDARALPADGFQPAPGKYIAYTGDVYRYDISDVENIVCIEKPAYDGGHDVIGDYPFDRGNKEISTCDCGFYFFTNRGSDTLYIVADIQTPQTWGYITIGGGRSKVELFPTKGTLNGEVYWFPLTEVAYTLEPGAEIDEVYIDKDDPRFVYIVVVSAGTLTLRRLGTFFYYNPQPEGATPPVQDGSNPAYSLWYFCNEVARVIIPPERPFPGSNGRDRRNPYVTSTDNDTLYVINLRNLFYNSYAKGVWNDTEGFYSPTTKTFQNDCVWLPQFNAFTYYGQTDLPEYEQAGFGVPKGAVADMTSYSLAQMFTDLALLVGYEPGQIEVDGLTDKIGGVQLNQQVKFTDLLQQLGASFRVDIIETPTGGIKFSRRPSNSPPDVSPLVTELLQLDDQDTHVIGIDRVTTNELPRVLQLGFISADFGFAVGSVSVRRTTYPAQTQFGPTSLSLSVPVVMSNANAVYFAGLALFDMWAGQTNFTIKVPPKYVAVEVGDFLLLTRPSGRRNLCKVTQVSMSQDRTMTITMSSINSQRPAPAFQGATGPSQYIPPPVQNGTLSTPNASGQSLTVVDSVPLAPATDAPDASFPFYFFGTTALDIYTQPTDNSAAPTLVGTVAPSVMGTCTSILPTLAPFRLDSNVILVSGVHVADLPVSQADWRDGGNVVLIGAPGRWELIYYGTATDTADGVSLSPCLRGRRGTEPNTQLHQSGDVAVWPTTPLRIDMPSTAQNQTFKVFGTAPGQRPSPSTSFYDTVFVAGQDQSPFAPCGVEAAKQPDGTIALTWHRRDRGVLPTDFWSDPPETDPLQFSVAIATVYGGTRTAKVSSQSYTYAVADQVSDGNDTAQRLLVTVSQVGDVVPMGTPWKGYVNVWHQ